MTKVTSANMHFQIITAIGSVRTIGTFEGLVGRMGDHVVLEVLTLVSPADTLATHRAYNCLPTASHAHTCTCLQRQGTASASPHPACSNKNKCSLEPLTVGTIQINGLY